VKKRKGDVTNFDRPNRIHSTRNVKIRNVPFGHSPSGDRSPWLGREGRSLHGPPVRGQVGPAAFELGQLAVEPPAELGVGTNLALNRRGAKIQAALLGIVPVTLSAESISVHLDLLPYADSAWLAQREAFSPIPQNHGPPGPSAFHSLLRKTRLIGSGSLCRPLHYSNPVAGNLPGCIFREPHCSERREAPTRQPGPFLHKPPSILSFCSRVY